MADEPQAVGNNSHGGRRSPASTHGDRRRRHHREAHRVDKLRWLRASVMGANDGILSIGALLVGVNGADLGRTSTLVAGIAGIAAGAGSMAMGEFVSVSAEKDTFEAEHALEARELEEDPIGETEELRAIYQRRGLSHDLAHEVATELMQHDALGAHMRDELGYVDARRPQPALAAASSFLSFCIGAALPLGASAAAADSLRGPVTAIATLVSLVVLGALAAWLAGGSIAKGSLRVTLGGVFALALSHLVGLAVAASVG